MLSKDTIDASISFKVLGGNILAYSILLAILRISFANEDEISSELSKLDLYSFISFLRFSNVEVYLSL